MPHTVSDLRSHSSRWIDDVRSWRSIPLAAMAFAFALAFLAAVTGYSFDLGFGWLKFQPADHGIRSAR